MNIPGMMDRVKAMSGFSQFPPLETVDPRYISKLRSTSGLNFKESVGAAKVAAKILRNSRSMAFGLYVWQSLEKALGGSDLSVVNRVGKACGKERSHKLVIELLDPLCKCLTVEDAQEKFKALLKKVCCSTSFVSNMRNI